MPLTQLHKEEEKRYLSQTTCIRAFCSEVTLCHTAFSISDYMARSVILNFHRGVCGWLANMLLRKISSEGSTLSPGSWGISDFFQFYRINTWADLSKSFSPSCAQHSMTVVHVQDLMSIFGRRRLNSWKHGFRKGTDNAQF